jgi:AI-2 transport protein TqsA
MLKSTSAVKLGFYARLALILHAVVIILFILYIGQTIFIPLFFSLLIAILLRPLVVFFEKKGMPASISCIIPLLLFILVIGGIIFFFSAELGSFSKDIPQMKQKFSGLLENAKDWLAAKYNIDDARQKDLINKSSHDMVSQGLSTLGTTFLGLVEFLILSIFCLLFSFFILYYRRLLGRFLFSFFTSQHHSRVTGVVTNVQDVINNYVVGLFVEMGLIIVLSFSALSLLGIKYALLFAIMAAVMNIIPYFGIYTAAALSMVIIFAHGTPNQALESGIVFIVIHIIDSNILLPKIVGGKVKMNPFVTLLAVFTGKLFWGIPGMFLFIPLVAIFKIISEAVPAFKPWSILLGEEKRTEKKQIRIGT